jgi:hypothetical protein
MLKRVAPHLPPEGGSYGSASRLTRAPVDLALSRCSVRQVMDGSRLASGPELTAPQRLAPRHPLILDGLSTFALNGRRQTSACTFYLVFKEPEKLRSSADFLSSGEPSNTTQSPYFCQPPALPITAERVRSGRSTDGRYAEEVRRAIKNAPEKLLGAFPARRAGSRFEPTEYTRSAEACQPRPLAVFSRPDGRGRRADRVDLCEG